MDIGNLIPERAAEAMYPLGPGALQDPPPSAKLATIEDIFHMFVDPQGYFDPAADGVIVVA